MSDPELFPLPSEGGERRYRAYLDIHWPVTLYWPAWVPPPPEQVRLLLNRLERVATDALQSHRGFVVIPIGDPPGQAYEIRLRGDDDILPPPTVAAVPPIRTSEGTTDARRRRRSRPARSE
jgi:hypothetical protein